MRDVLGIRTSLSAAHDAIEFGRHDANQSSTPTHRRGALLILRRLGDPHRLIELLSFNRCPLHSP
jgi:hypothetical protein